MGFLDKLFGASKAKPSAPLQDSAVHSITIQNEAAKIIKCRKCSGHYNIKDGKYGIFAGCSNFPACRSTMKLPDLVLEYIRVYGIGVYKWERQCYKCGKVTPVYSYYLDYELADLDDFFSGMGSSIGLGELSHVDELLSKQIPSIQKRFSRTTQSSYMANTCVHCGALQGKNYVVDDPHEIIGELWHDRGMGKYLIQTLHFEDVTPLKKDIDYLYTQGE